MRYRRDETLKDALITYIIQDPVRDDEGRHRALQDDDGCHRTLQDNEEVKIVEISDSDGEEDGSRAEQSTSQVKGKERGMCSILPSNYCRYSITR